MIRFLKSLSEKSGNPCRAMAAAFTAAAMLLSQNVASYAGVTYMPDVTEEMNTAEYWISLRGAAADVLMADTDAIKKINAANLVNEDTKMNDLLNYDVFTDTLELNEKFRSSALDDLKKYQEKGYFDRYGNVLGDEMIEAIAGNTANPAAVQNQAPLYAIVVKRTTLNAFPTEEIITDEQGDLNFDYNILSAVRVNEPLVIKTVSRDGRWYYALSSNCNGWVRAEDVAVCSSKYEWENAWNIPDSSVLVVTGSRIFLAESNTHPETSNLMLTAGTVLELAPAGSYGARVTNRSTIGNYVVYIPVRNADGSYRKELALVRKCKEVNEGYLPLTMRNVINVAFGMLGEPYGWGGMLSSNDCSGYVGDIYRCFGIILPRNTTWQAASWSLGYDVTDFSNEQKAAILNNMPIGSVLFFKGHEMLYLGTVNGKYYVVNSVSSLTYEGNPEVMRTRSVMINSLDTERANRSTWLSNIYKIQIPYMMF